MINGSKIAEDTMRMICPFLIIFGVYLIANGHLSPGGGFQGGVALSAFFICRYMISDTQNIRLSTIMMLEKLFYIGIILIAAFFIFFAAYTYFPVLKNYYLVIMNLLIGLKVACGFQVIFFRFIIYERM